jgi:hypothetical protein
MVEQLLDAAAGAQREHTRLLALQSEVVLEQELAALEERRDSGRGQRQVESRGGGGGVDAEGETRAEVGVQGYAPPLASAGVYDASEAGEAVSRGAR